MSCESDYTYSNLLIERQAAIEGEYKHDLKKHAKWILAIYLVVASAILLGQPVAFFLAKL